MILYESAAFTFAMLLPRINLSVSGLIKMTLEILNILSYTPYSFLMIYMYINTYIYI